MDSSNSPRNASISDRKGWFGLKSSSSHNKRDTEPIGPSKPPIAADHPRKSSRESRNSRYFISQKHPQSFLTSRSSRGYSGELQLQQRPPSWNDSGHDFSHEIPHPDPAIKQEPSGDSFNKLSLADQSRQIPSFDSMRPSKRPAPNQDVWPNKKEDRGSTSPYSTLHEQVYSHAPSPPFDSTGTQSPSAGYRSAPRTPLSSPRLVSPHLVTTSRQPPRQSLLSSNQPIYAQNQDEERKISICTSPYGTPSSNTPVDSDTKMLLQPETRSISQDQLVNEVKGIYAGLVMVEKKCVEICQEQAQTTTKLSNEQWQALITLHRTLLHEHHDFFLASQHPTASSALRRLPTKYAMPARMWRHGIHSFLELLRHRLPHSLEHMLSFVYLAYQMMGLLMESVPAFHETWIECLGDLARYRMAIEEADMRDRENWSNVARMWYNRAADRSPTTGRIQHHLAVLARPNIVRQLFYYSKALISVIPFVNARDSIMLLFTPFLDKSDLTNQKYPLLESSLVTAAGILFTCGSVREYCAYVKQFVSELDSHITRSGSNWKVQGAEVASSLIACIFAFGSDESFLWKAFRANLDKTKGIQTEKRDPLSETTPIEDPVIKNSIHRKFWENSSISSKDFQQARLATGDRPDVKFVSADEVTSYVLPVWAASISIVAGKVGDRNTLPFMHLTLAFLWSLSYVPGALIYLENYVPWTKIVLSLNTLSRSGVVDARIESTEFPQQQSGTGRQLPEDFPMRGLIWASYYFPSDFFEGQVVDEDERTLELPSHAAPRAERCLWLGVRLASLHRYISYNYKSKQFSCTGFALSLANDSVMDLLQVQNPAADKDVDAPMIDVA
ncbi:uncharacterized protein Z518_00996 [Rhinocladiella mackenziei CBS 650.93]|uniref:DNA/RNA-binding domain-containing protein n=1 Tax=Rhinocladiella mackenziei CBS 650.93 TaxID=1442369 RepID=A0A0D2JK93_9EURO|nr:uncharacterized protein Z518_00996 [Rhinocladiella mackenziei CBS 650.93]KIX09915.1 hypothetical protein Z518_00996 [Rhinocladiella mackenziei CBS 650.93]